jgi:hypothetical protein
MAITIHRAFCNPKNTSLLPLYSPDSATPISHSSHSLFRVLFIFPSRYLFAIGLLSIFSLGWHVPPNLDCITKQSDSSGEPKRLCVYIDGTITLHGNPFQDTFAYTPSSPCSLPHNYNSLPHGSDSNFGLFPLRSPLLWESLLVSFPPLTDMLKFSGYSKGREAK